MYHIISKGRDCDCYIERHIKSVLSQSIVNWRHYIVLDPSEDCSVDMVLRNWHDRLVLIQNKRPMWCMANVLRAVKSANPAPKDILAWLDCDDLFYDENSLAVRERDHEMSGAWLVYGSFVRESTGGRCSVSQAYDTSRPVREQDWHASHLKSMRYDLFSKIPDAYLRGPDGEYCKYCDDMAFMWAGIELAGWKRCKHATVDMVIYNDLSYLNSCADEAERPTVKAIERHLRGLAPLSVLT